MGLNILKGWASGLLFNAKEIESERASSLKSIVWAWVPATE